MSMSLVEVLENAGYDVLHNVDDAKWLLSQRDNFDALCDKAEMLEDDYMEYQDFIDIQEELNNFDNHPTFEEWMAERS